MIACLMILLAARSMVRITDGPPRPMVLLIALAIIATACGPASMQCHADDRLGRNSARDRHQMVLAGNPDRAAKQPVQLREGTLIPPTVGRVVMLGRRWAFVPDRAEPQQTVNLNPPQTRSSLAAHRSQARPTRLGARSASVSRHAATHLVALQEKESVREEVPHLVIAENLMLQRIVESVRADASDDRWLISGEVTEFFNENRLLIRTAQRANTN